MKQEQVVNLIVESFKAYFKKENKTVRVNGRKFRLGCAFICKLIDQGLVDAEVYKLVKGQMHLEALQFNLNEEPGYTTKHLNKIINHFNKFIRAREVKQGDADEEMIESILDENEGLRIVRNVNTKSLSREEIIAQYEKVDYKNLTWEELKQLNIGEIKLYNY